MGHLWAFVFAQRVGQVLTTLTMPTPALYMESLADAAKGKVKAAEREAEKEKEEDAKKKERRLTQKRSPPAATPAASRPRRPSDAAPQRACACSSALARRC